MLLKMAKVTEKLSDTVARKLWWYKLLCNHHEEIVLNCHNFLHWVLLAI